MLKKKWNPAGLYSNPKRQKRHALGRTSCGRSPTYSSSKAREARHYFWHIRPRYHGLLWPDTRTRCHCKANRVFFSLETHHHRVNLSGRERISYTAASWKASPQLMWGELGSVFDICFTSLMRFPKFGQESCACDVMPIPSICRLLRAKFHPHGIILKLQRGSQLPYATRSLHYHSTGPRTTTLGAPGSWVWDGRIYGVWSGKWCPADGVPEPFYKGSPVLLLSNWI